MIGKFQPGIVLSSVACVFLILIDVFKSSLLKKVYYMQVENK